MVPKISRIVSSKVLMDLHKQRIAYRVIFGPEGHSSPIGDLEECGSHRLLPAVDISISKDDLGGRICCKKLVHKHDTRNVFQNLPKSAMDCFASFSAYCIFPQKLVKFLLSERCTVTFEFGS